MLRPFHTKTDTARWLMVFSMIMGGWIEYLFVHVTNPASLTGMITYAPILPALGVGLIITAWLLQREDVLRQPTPIIMKWLALISLGLGILTVFFLPVSWGSVAVTIAGYPLLYEWVRRIPTMSGKRRRMFLLAWIGGFMVATGLVMASQWIGVTRTSLTALCVANLVSWRLPVAPSKKLVSAIKIPNPMLALSFGLFFALGVGASSTVRLGLQNGPSSQPMRMDNLLWGTAVICATAAMPLVLRKKTRWLVYIGCGATVAAFLVRIETATRAPDHDLVVLLALGTWVLLFWWLSLLFGFLRHGPRVLAMGLAVVTTAVSVSWYTGLVLSGAAQDRWMLGGSIMIMVLLLPAARARSGSPGGVPNPSAGPGTHIEAFYLEAKLTQQERKIVDLLLSGSNNQDILGTLYISINTLKTHLRNIYRKTNTANRRELMGVVEQYRTYSAGE